LLAVQQQQQQQQLLLLVLAVEVAEQQQLQGQHCLQGPAAAAAVDLSCCMIQLQQVGPVDQAACLGLQMLLLVMGPRAMGAVLPPWLVLLLLLLVG
jgi:hypothetical protein